MDHQLGAVWDCHLSEPETGKETKLLRKSVIELRVEVNAE